MSNGLPPFPLLALSNLYWVSAVQVGMNFRMCGLLNREVLHYLTAKYVFWLLCHFLVCLCLGHVRYGGCTSNAVMSQSFKCIYQITELLRHIDRMRHITYAMFNIS